MSVVNHVGHRRHDGNTAFAGNTLNELTYNADRLGARPCRNGALFNANAQFRYGQSQSIETNRGDADGKGFRQFFIVNKRIFFAFSAAYAAHPD